MEGRGEGGGGERRLSRVVIARLWPCIESTFSHSTIIDIEYRWAGGWVGRGGGGLVQRHLVWGSGEGIVSSHQSRRLWPSA